MLTARIPKQIVAKMFSSLYKVSPYTSGCFLQLLSLILKMSIWHAMYCSINFRSCTIIDFVEAKLCWQSLVIAAKNSFGHLERAFLEQTGLEMP